MNSNFDIFDRIMTFPPLRLFEPFYKRHKEILLYLFFGGLCFILSTSLFAFLIYVVELNELVSNVIVWIACVLFQFFTNRTWVFNNKAESWKIFSKQLLEFSGGRLLTLGIEELILAVFITWFGFNAMLVKFAAQIIVIVLNYIISKVWIFK